MAEYQPSVESERAQAAPAEQADGIEVLTSDHRAVKQLFDQYLSEGDPGLVQQICDMLEVHDRAERTYFYPDVADEGGSEAKALVEDGKVEHQALTEIIGQLRAMNGDEPEFSEMVAWLQEQVLHHVQEEEGQLFPIARESLGQARLVRIGEQITDLKKRAAEAH